MEPVDPERQFPRRLVPGIARVPAPLSLNQIDPSDLTTTSLGAVRRFPSKLSGEESTVVVPSYSVRVSRCASISHVIRWPWRSRVLPLA